MFLQPFCYNIYIVITEPCALPHGELQNQTNALIVDIIKQIFNKSIYIALNL